MKIGDDKYTEMLNKRVSEWDSRIYAIEDDMSKIEENEAAILGYLKDICSSMPLGLALRRFLCARYGSPAPGGYTFTLSDGRTVAVSDYMTGNYDIQNADIGEYTDVFLDVNKTYNTGSDGEVSPDFTRAEARRLLRLASACTRSKMFLIGFALHMDSDDMNKFLTDVLAEQTYNMRRADEIIAFFCQSHEEYNSYREYVRLTGELTGQTAPADAPPEPESGYTSMARQTLRNAVDTVEQLSDFIRENSGSFSGYSRTAYREFMSLLDKAFKKTRIQSFSNDDYLTSATASTPEARRAQNERINRAIELRAVENTEQLAKAMLRCIPRYSSERIQNGKKVIVNDFIPISNGEPGQRGKKEKTTELPKEITMNLLMKDRLDDLIRGIKPVERKDLVFLKFYTFSLDIAENQKYGEAERREFVDECNAMLWRCGMSRLYPANRFENLIMLSLYASDPFEMFEIIIEYSFINEPESCQG